MKTASVAAIALVAAFALSGTASSKELIAPNTGHALKTAARVTEPKREVRKPMLDFTPTQSITKSRVKPANAPSVAPSGHSGIMVNPWIVPTTF